MFFKKKSQKFTIREAFRLPLFVVLFAFNYAEAQNNLSGQSGLINVPSATMTEDGTFKIGYNYNPIDYSLRFNRKNPEQILYISLVLLPRLELNVNLLQALSTDTHPTKEALGDRQIDIKYLFVREKRYVPAVSIIMSSPFTIDAAMLTQVVVATKHWELTKKIDFEVNLGYGSPYFIYRNVNNLENVDIFSGFKLEKKSEYKFNNNYLTGIFGGAKFSYQKKIGFMAEWDTNKFNVGIFAKLFKRLNVQASLLNKSQVLWGVAYNCPLFVTPKRLKKS